MKRVHSIFCNQKVILLGHINRLREFPSVTIGIFQKGDKFFAVWPSTDVAILSDVHTTAELLSIRNYHPLSKEYEIAPGTQMVFALDEHDLLIVSIAEVKQQIRLRLGPAQEEFILREYLIVDA